MKFCEFFDIIVDIVEGFCQKIELEVEVFKVGDCEKVECCFKVKDLEMGYWFFCDNYFLYYFIKVLLKLYEDLFGILLEMVVIEDGQKCLVIVLWGLVKLIYIS